MPEQHVDLKDSVPVFITYLTAVPEGAEIAFYPDVYHRDGQALAKLGATGTLASRR